MKQFTLADLRALDPCYDPSKYLPENWTGNVLDILDVKAAPFPDRLWILLRADFVSEKLMRLFAVWCARQVQHLMQDKRSLNALDVSEAFANGNATEAELDSARDSASAAEWDSAWAAEWGSAWAAEWDSASAAARGAAMAATWTAAGDARAAAMAAQENKLREMITAGMETGDVK